MEHETAALRDFNDADVACGSIASDRHDRDARPMSASPPIAVKHWHRSETPPLPFATLCAAAEDRSLDYLVGDISRHRSPCPLVGWSGRAFVEEHDATI